MLLPVLPLAGGIAIADEVAAIARTEPMLRQASATYTLIKVNWIATTSKNKHAARRRQSPSNAGTRRCMGYIHPVVIAFNPVTQWIERMQWRPQGPGTMHLVSPN